jgi:hypothetical protein
LLIRVKRVLLIGGIAIPKGPLPITDRGISRDTLICKLVFVLGKTGRRASDREVSGWILKSLDLSNVEVFPADGIPVGIQQHSRWAVSASLG